MYCALIAYIIFEAPAEDRNINTLVDMIGGARDPEVLNLLKGITTLLEAIKDKDLRLYIGDREIAHAANRGGKALGYPVVTG